MPIFMIEVQTFFKQPIIKNPYNKYKYGLTHPLCEICRKKKHEVHHIIFSSRGGSDEDWNFISVCLYHHNIFHGLRIKLGMGRISWRSKRIALEKRWLVFYSAMKAYQTIEDIGLEKVNLIKRVLYIED